MAITLAGEHVSSQSADGAVMGHFFETLQSQNMDALWRGPRPSPHTPNSRAPHEPFHWSWDTIRPALMRAGELVQPGPDAERRVLQLIHPGLGPARSASHSLTANVQLVLPGEISPSHRHSIAAIRFIIEGRSTVTIVEGEPVEMHPGDLVLTPAGGWHGHVNEGSEPSIWMDSLDRSVAVALRQVHQETYPELLQKPTLPIGSGQANYRRGTLLPIGKQAPSPVSPLMRYAWEDTQAALLALATLPSDPFEDVAMDYVNPLTGGHVLPTIGCRMQMIRPGVHTRAHRHAYPSVHHVFRGSGTTIVEGREIQWKQGDFFTIPPWSWHEHINASGDPAFVFSANDLPIMDALGLSAEDIYPHYGGYQLSGDKKGGQYK